MSERAGGSQDTAVRPPEGGAPEVSEEEGARAVAEASQEAVAPQPAESGDRAEASSGAPVAATVDPEAAVQASDEEGTGPAVDRPAPALDAAAATPDRPEPASSSPADERPELLVAGAFAGGLLLAVVLRRLGSG